MKRVSLTSFSLLIVTLMFACTASAQVKYYKPIDLGTLGGGFSNGTGVNNPSEAAGVSGATDGAVHGFAAGKTFGNMTDLSTLGGPNSFAQGINDGHQIVGQSDTSDGPSHAFLYTLAAGMQDLGTLGGSISGANALNFSSTTGKATQIVGSSLISGDTALHAAAWDASQHIGDLGTLGGTNSSALGNNCNGEVVGFSNTADDATQDAFVWDSVHGMQDLGTLGGSVAQANAINCGGTIVGSSSLPGDSQTDAFVYANGSMKDLGNLGMFFSQANAINNPGTIVGYSVTADGSDTHAIVWTSKGGMQDLNNLIPADSGWDLTDATSIANNGRIVGTGTINGEGHAFLLIPTPTLP